MTARYRSDAIGHGDDCQTEYERYAEHVDGRRTATHAGDDGRAAAEQNECESADKLGDQLIYDVYPSFVTVTTYRKRVSAYRDSQETDSIRGFRHDVDAPTPLG